MEPFTVRTSSQQAWFCNLMALEKVRYYARIVKGFKAYHEDPATTTRGTPLWKFIDENLKTWMISIRHNLRVLEYQERWFSAYKPKFNYFTSLYHILLKANIQMHRQVVVGKEKEKKEEIDQILSRQMNLWLKQDYLTKLERREELRSLLDHQIIPYINQIVTHKPRPFHVSSSSNNNDDDDNIDDAAVVLPDGRFRDPKCLYCLMDGASFGTGTNSESVFFECCHQGRSSIRDVEFPHLLYVIQKLDLLLI